MEYLVIQNDVNNTAQFVFCTDPAFLTRYGEINNWGEDENPAEWLNCWACRTNDNIHDPHSFVVRNTEIEKLKNCAEMMYNVIIVDDVDGDYIQYFLKLVARENPELEEIINNHLNKYIYKS